MPRTREEPTVLRVSSESDPRSVTEAILGEANNYGYVDIEIIGAGALNQAIKATVIARESNPCLYLDLIFIPAFFSTEISGRELTGIRLLIQFSLRSSLNTI